MRVILCSNESQILHSKGQDNFHLSQKLVLNQNMFQVNQNDSQTMPGILKKKTTTHFHRRFYN